MRQWAWCQVLGFSLGMIYELVEFFIIYNFTPLVTFLNVVYILEMDNRLYQQLSTAWTYRWQHILDRVMGPKFIVECSLFVLILILLNKTMLWKTFPGHFWCKICTCHYAGILSTGSFYIDALTLLFCKEMILPDIEGTKFILNFSCFLPIH